MIEKSGFRADLEGLRGVAVLLVLLYHARAPLVDGGYIGVDVFFVLSGFLITGIIVRELMGTGRLSLSGFYARRARRLLPAAALVLVITMIASVIVLPPLRVPAVAGDTISAALYVSNIRFAIQATDYLGSELAPSPVLHFWSLSVEEQFYIFWPTLLAVVAGATFLRGRHDAGIRRLAIVLAVVLVGSLGLSILLTSVNQPWAFFSLPTRAWELALGGLLALPGAARWVPARVAVPAGWIGLALIVAAGLFLDTSVAFPGVAALVPTIGAALVIAAGLAATPTGSSRYAAGRVLGLAPIRFLGLISYSLYLWHWPILTLPEAAAGEPLRWPIRVALVGLRDRGRHGHPAMGRGPDPSRPIRRAADAPVPGHGRCAVGRRRRDDGIARARRGRRVDRRPRDRRRGDQCRPPSRPDASLGHLAVRTSRRLAARRHHVPVGHAHAGRDAAATRTGPRTSGPGPAARDCRR